MKKVVWGVVSTAKIGTEKVLPAMKHAAHVDLRAIASRSLPSAQAAAGRLGIPQAYGSYEELFDDPEIEAVYIPVPNHLHVPLTLAAARKGKHVLCEKPIAIDAAQARELKACEVLVMEAFMVRFHPQWLHARDLVRSGRIGELRAIQVFFSYYLDDPKNVRNQADIGGGGIYDIGCYAIVSGRFFFGAEPKRAVSLIDRDPDLKVDRVASALLDFGEGRRLDFTVATQLVPYQRVELCGTRGRIEIPIPFNAPANGATRLLVDDGSALDGSGITVETMPPCDQYGLEADAFSRAVRGEIALPYGVDDAVANMKAIDALFRSEKSGRFEPV